jgi:hypothetical protein
MALGVGGVQAAASAHDGRTERHSDRHHGDHGGRHHGDWHDSSPLTEQSFSVTADISGGGTVVATGAINAEGQDVVVSDTQDNFVFPDGTLTVYHAVVRSKDRFDQEECTDSFWETGRYVISSGTGQYEGFSGSGEYRAAGHVENACEGQTPTGGYKVWARGSINLPTP